ncbi:MAG TPA: MOSC N-terminal beta barrel domain-containing protein [Steroidobacteraceae bacterium]|nr:MOSC N-terminal beta barrel domain-containing protein [Steroidobacteraceae bacterium]
MTATLARLFIYPVKSAAGIECDRVELGPQGFRHDREWMIVDPAGRFVTQREEGRLALLATAIEGGRLRLSIPSGQSICVALDHGGESVAVRVWSANCRAFDAGREATQLLSGFLGRPLRLVRFDTAQPRFADSRWTAGREVATLFADGYPLLVLSQASIADLSARVGRELPVQRFRPNILLEGVGPYAEDAASVLLSGDARLQLTKACTRCAITTIDHATGERTGAEPLATLKSYRFDPALRGVVFGRNAYALAGVGSTLTRGAPASIIPG